MADKANEILTQRTQVSIGESAQAPPEPIEKCCKKGRNFSLRSEKKPARSEKKIRLTGEKDKITK